MLGDALKDTEKVRYMRRKPLKGVTCIKKICLLALLCLVLTAWPVMAEGTDKAPALVNEAQALMEAGDYEAAVPLLREAAEKGDATGQRLLGNCYFNGLGVEKDEQEAVKYYRLSAEQGNAPAQFNLGLSYENGQGVEQDYAKAAEYFKLAADQGLDIAQHELGYLYYLGYGVEQDYKKAFEYYSLSAGQNYAPAQTALGYMYYL